MVHQTPSRHVWAKRKPKELMSQAMPSLQSLKPMRILEFMSLKFLSQVIVLVRSKTKTIIINNIFRQTHTHKLSKRTHTKQINPYGLSSEPDFGV